MLTKSLTLLAFAILSAPLSQAEAAVYMIENVHCSSGEVNIIYKPGNFMDSALVKDVTQGFKATLVEDHNSNALLVIPAQGKLKHFCANAGPTAWLTIALTFIGGK